MFFSHLYLTIYFLSVKTHTHVSHFRLSFLLAAVKQNVEMKNRVMLVLINAEKLSERQLR